MGAIIHRCDEMPVVRLGKENSLTLRTHRCVVPTEDGRMEPPSFFVEDATSMPVKRRNYEDHGAVSQHTVRCSEDLNDLPRLGRWTLSAVLSPAEPGFRGNSARETCEWEWKAGKRCILERGHSTDAPFPDRVSLMRLMGASEESVDMGREKG